MPYDAAGGHLSRPGGSSVTGLQLTTVKAVLPLLGGKIGCQNVSAGSTFWVEARQFHYYTEMINESCVVSC